MRLLVLAAFGTAIVILFYTSGLRSAQDVDGKVQDFYHKTMNAMENRVGHGQAVLDQQTGLRAGTIPADRDGDGDIDEDDTRSGREMQQRLKAAEQEAKDKANSKSPLPPDPPSNVIGVGSAAGGQDKKGKSVGDGPVDSKADSKGPAETQEERIAEVELDSILKKSPGKSTSCIPSGSFRILIVGSPVIIFSKSYCPHSRRAKGVLLEKYSISPDPYVVELDHHPIGSALQDKLLAKTGRRTVPNIMINGVSIGGADDIVAMDNDEMLVKKIVDLGSKKVAMTERFVAGGSHA